MLFTTCTKASVMLCCLSSDRASQWYWRRSSVVDGRALGSIPDTSGKPPNNASYWAFNLGRLQWHALQTFLNHSFLWEILKDRWLDTKESHIHHPIETTCVVPHQRWSDCAEELHPRQMIETVHRRTQVWYMTSGASDSVG